MDVNWIRAWEGLPRGKRFIMAFFPPDFSDSRNVVWDGILESVWMAIIATVAGIAISVPVGLGAASNLAPKWVYLVCRAIVAGFANFSGSDIGDFCGEVVRFWPVCRIYCIVNWHHWFLCQIAG